MAVNNGRPDCQSNSQQSSDSVICENGAVLQRARTASPENGRSSPTMFNPYYTGRPRTPANGNKSATLDRQEIIRRIKSRESRPNSPELERFGPPDRQEIRRRVKSREPRPVSPDLQKTLSRGTSRKRKSPGPRPITPTAPDVQAQQDNQSIGLQIERPRSALHRGDFRDREQADSSSDNFGLSNVESRPPSLSTSPVAPWHPQFPIAALRPAHDFWRPYREESGVPTPVRPTRVRATSHASLASSFAYKAPTSPLVQSSRPDTPEPIARQRTQSPDTSRRHTIVPLSLMTYHTALEYPTSARMSGRDPLPLRAEKTFPYQAHQPRRSLNSMRYNSLPQTPVSSSVRQPSISGDSPLHHAPMVGSYEESILRGRMSTTPSRPLNFMAQIGVLGKGDCKSYLRCPPHVSVPFPAVFYSYGAGAKNPTSDQPSPYVGLIDVENSLATEEDAQDKRLQKVQGNCSNGNSRDSSPHGVREDGPALDAQARRRRRQKAKRRSGSPKAPPGGSYRIPQQGQLQIVIKNPNKTAVKLFLVPYDLSDMEPGQKTFIRQRSYSAGPIIDMPLSSRKNLGTDRPEAALSATGDPNDRPVLRYLIHLHICCPSKGRYFLYKSIRVVFANRVPDGKEKLRNEIQLPEPKYSTYKVGRDSNVAFGPHAIAKDDARRHSVIHHNYANDPRYSRVPEYFAQSLPSGDHSSRPMPSLPRHYTALPALNSRPSSRGMSDVMDMDSISPGTSSVRSPTSSNEDPSQRIVPPLDDPFNFQRDHSRERRSGARSESLLSRRLIDLAVQKQDSERQMDRVPK